MRCSFAGLWNGRIHSGQIYLHEVGEFLLSCEAAGWDSVAVASGSSIVAKYRRAA